MEVGDENTWFTECLHKKRLSQINFEMAFLCLQKIGQVLTSLSQNLPVSLNFCILGNQVVSIRPTTGIKPLYTTIATVTMNLIVSAAIVLLNPYVTIYISYKIPPFALSVHIPDVSTSIYVEVDSKVLLGLPFCDKAFVR